jgi:ClpP class serine protease
MPGWTEILNEVLKSGPDQHKDADGVRLKYLQQLSALTGRNVIGLYSGWLQKAQLKAPAFSISDAAMPGLMSAVRGLDKDRGLDLILHTPGGGDKRH